MNSEQHVQLAEKYGAHNYAPLPVVIEKSQGCWVTDVDGKKYIDMLSSYSALNFGHQHPQLVRALTEQLNRVVVTSRAFYNDQYGPFCEALARFSDMEMVLPMNTGAEAVETAIKTARKWGYEVKGIPNNQAEIICFEGNFHGRTTTVISFSTDPDSTTGFGPYTPGFKIVPYGDLETVAQAINANTAGILVEPIQGEGGIIIPPDGFLTGLRQLCDDKNVLLMMDEIQTGLCRTGRRFACQHEDVHPDIFIMGKALGGGLLPVSAISSSREILKVMTPGVHGSTFGGMPLSCAVAREAIRLLEEEKYESKAIEMGAYFMQRLTQLDSPHIKEIRGKGLLIGVELKPDAGTAKPYCKSLKNLGVLCKDTHEQVIRFAPPLVITREEIDWAMERVEQVLTGSAVSA